MSTRRPPRKKQALSHMVRCISALTRTLTASGRVTAELPMPINHAGPTQSEFAYGTGPDEELPGVSGLQAASYLFKRK
jgi:hypothetical protein